MSTEQKLLPCPVAEAIREFENANWHGSKGYHAGLIKAATIAEEVERAAQPVADLSKDYGMPEPEAYLVEVDGMTLLHRALYRSPRAKNNPLVRLDAVSPLVAGLRAENSELRKLLAVRVEASRLDEVTNERDALQAEAQKERDRYMREVYGLNNEGDPIGGDPAGGLVNMLELVRTQRDALRITNDKLVEMLRDASVIVRRNVKSGWSAKLMERIDAALKENER